MELCSSNVGGGILVGRALQHTLVMSKEMSHRWWAWICIFAPSCKTSMEVKLSPIEVEIRFAILEVEETHIEGEIFRATTCGGLGQ